MKIIAVYFNKLKLLPDEIGIISKDSIVANEIATLIPSAEKMLLQDEFLLHIRYLGEKESPRYTRRFSLSAPRMPLAFQESVIQIPLRDTYVHPSGYIEVENNLVLEDYLGWRKLADILPLDYKLIYK